MGNIHKGDVHPTVIIYTELGTHIEVTHDHFVMTTNGLFMHIRYRLEIC